MNEKETVKKFTDELVNNQVDIPGENRQIVNENFWDLVNNEGKKVWPVKLIEPDWTELIDRSPQYTKTEIENRLYQIIDNETIFPPGEDMGSAYKLLNKFLDSLE